MVDIAARADAMFHDDGVAMATLGVVLGLPAFLYLLPRLTQRSTDALWKASYR